MDKLFNSIKSKLRQWLGINDICCDLNNAHSAILNLEKWMGETGAITAVGIDAHLHGDSESLIILCSKLHGGMIKFIPAQFKDVREMMSFIEMMEGAYRPERFYFDGPPALTREIDHALRRKTGRRYTY